MPEAERGAHLNTGKRSTLHWRNHDGRILGTVHYLKMQLSRGPSIAMGPLLTGMSSIFSSSDVPLRHATLAAPISVRHYQKVNIDARIENWFR
jgi:hypothetical protein